MALRLLVTALLVAWVVLRILRVRRQIASRRDTPPLPARWDPYAVLGVSSGATPEELVRAYREQMKRYHPDRVADMPPEFQELAHRKAIEIQRAYAELGGRR